MAIGVSRGDPLAEALEAAHLSLDPTSGVVAGQALPRRARPKCIEARRISFLALAARPSSFQARPFLRMGMTAVPPRPAIAEWQVRKHGPGRRRQWRKVHLAMDLATGDIRGVEFTSSQIGDSPVLPSLLEQIPADQPIGTVTADGA